MAGLAGAAGQDVLDRVVEDVSEVTSTTVPAVLAAIIWGLVQGLTEFLPISSSGHLVIVPEFLNEIGMDIEPPTLAVSAVLHLGTLLAVLPLIP